MSFTAADHRWMAEALQLAERGLWTTSPNPRVGCVLVAPSGEVVGAGWHEKAGGPHAEIHALRAARDRARGATAYVTLEPCAHHGKTPPCTDAIVQAGICRVVVALRDPNPKVNGLGLDFLRRAGIEVTEGILEEEARDLLAPYLTLLEKNRPWIIAKWAMTLDGRTASRTGSSRWISSEPSRFLVHRLRSRVDAILVGSGTVRADDPGLTARLPEGDAAARIPLRVVLDSRAETALQSQLVQTARQIPVLIVVGHEASQERITMLRQAGCDLLQVPSEIRENRENSYRRQIDALLATLAERKMTNLLVEGGSRVFGLLFDMKLIDEVHAFIAPKLIGGKDAVPVIAGRGLADMAFPCLLKSPRISLEGDDVYVQGRIR